MAGVEIGPIKVCFCSGDVVFDVVRGRVCFDLRRFASRDLNWPRFLL